MDKYRVEMSSLGLRVMGNYILVRVQESNGALHFPFAETTFPSLESAEEFRDILDSTVAEGYHYRIFRIVLEEVKV